MKFHTAIHTDQPERGREWDEVLSVHQIWWEKWLIGIRIRAFDLALATDFYTVNKVLCVLETYVTLGDCRYMADATNE